MDDNLIQEMFLLAAKDIELAIVGNLINQEGCDATVAVFRQSSTEVGHVLRGFCTPYLLDTEGLVTL